MADAAATVKLENKSARVIYIGIGGGASIMVPPTEGVGGITHAFEGDKARAAFEKALATPELKRLIEGGELVVAGISVGVTAGGVVVSGGSGADTLPTDPNAPPPSGTTLPAEPPPPPTPKKKY